MSSYLIPSIFYDIYNLHGEIFKLSRSHDTKKNYLLKNSVQLTPRKFTGFIFLVHYYNTF